MLTAVTVLFALILDAALGELRRAHPLIAFGRSADWLERHWNRSAQLPGWRVVAGFAAMLVLVVPSAVLIWLLAATDGGWLVEILVLYFALGMQSLREHGEAVARALRKEDLPAARAALGRMVSRDVDGLGESRIAAATAESVLENGNDAVFGAIFWFVIAGAPGVVVYRLVNTLDAMWGYRTERHDCFGRTAATLDDLLNWIPARLTVLTYALASKQLRRALACACRQGAHSDSPNAGRVMAAGAGGLGVRLGGSGRYHGNFRRRPRYGLGAVADTSTIDRSVRLVLTSVMLWAGGLLIAGWWFA